MWGYYTKVNRFKHSYYIYNKYKSYLKSDEDVDYPINIFHTNTLISVKHMQLLKNGPINSLLHL